MAYVSSNPRTKKALKEAVASGEPVRLINTSPFVDHTGYTGRVAVEGPHYPEPHRWYASVDVIDGRIVKVVS